MKIIVLCRNFKLIIIIIVFSCFNEMLDDAE